MLESPYFNFIGDIMATQTRSIFLVTALLATAASADSGSRATPKAPPPVPKTTIGIVLPSAQLGQGNTGADVAEPVRTTLISYLNGPKTTLISMKARIPVQADAEAQESGIKYVVFVSVKTKKNEGGLGFGKFLSSAAPLAAMIPGMSGGLGSMGGAAAQVASTVATQAAQSEAIESQQQAMQQITGASQNSVKKGDEVTLSYRVMTPGDPTPVVTKSTVVKVNENGEDVLSPLLEQAAGDMLTAVTNATAAKAASPAQ